MAKSKSKQQQQQQRIKKAVQNLTSAQNKLGKAKIQKNNVWQQQQQEQQKQQQEKVRNVRKINENDMNITNKNNNNYGNNNNNNNAVVVNWNKDKVVVVASNLPQVELPDSSLSYNPAFEDHQNSLGEAFAYYSRLEEKRQLLDKMTPLTLLNRNKPEADEDGIHKINGMKIVGGGIHFGGIISNVNDDDADDDDEEEEEEEDDDKYLERIKLASLKKKSLAHANERLTTADRNRQRRVKAEAVELKQRKSLKKMNRDIGELSMIKKELKKEGEDQKLKQDLDGKMKKDKLLKPHKIGPVRYQPDAPQFLLNEELPDKLLSLKPQGSLLQDRLKSLQRRNIVEPRLRQVRKTSKSIKRIAQRSEKNENSRAIQNEILDAQKQIINQKQDQKQAQLLLL